MSTPPPRNPSQGAMAGMLLLSGVVLGTLIGAGLGALIGAVALMLIIGLFAGFAIGIWAVIARFRDL
jgi:F0F1-type ATP synthase assembly protein I